MARGSRGEGFGEEKGEATPCDLVRASAGGVGAKPGGTAGVEVDGRGELVLEVGVAARLIQGAGAGDLVRKTLAARAGGGEVWLSLVVFHCHMAPSTASSNALPFNDVGAPLNSSSSASVLASSSSCSSSRTGLHRSYIFSDTMMTR